MFGSLMRHTYILMEMYIMDMHFVKLKQKFLVTFHTNNSLQRIMFIIKFYYIRAMFLRQRHFENMCFNYDVILNVMDFAFSKI